MRELERVREKVLEDLPEALLIGDDRRRQRRIDLEPERQALLLCHMPKRPLGIQIHVRQGDRRETELHPSRLNLGQIENVIDQAEEIVPGGVDRAGELDTWAMLRTWSVRLRAMKLTLSVGSFQVPATPGTWA